MNRTYELMFIVRPDMTEEDLDKLISTLQSVVPPAGGNVVKVEKMGKRRLAYTVRRFHDGIYVLMVIEGGGPVMHELERRLRVSEPVIKFLTVRIDEEQKRLANAYVAQLDQQKVFPGKIVTDVTPLKAFYRAEDYHQDYAYHNPNNPYIQVCDRPKIAALEQQFPELFVDYQPKK